MHFFLINPQAAGGKAARVWREVETALIRRRIPYDSVLSTDADPMQVKRAAALWLHGRTDDTGALIVVGGDGTIHHVLPTIIGTDVPLGLIPAGSGNDMARSLGIPLDPLQALDVILRGNTKEVDIIGMDEQFCINVAGIGIDGEVARQVNRSRYKRFLNRLGLGTLAYVLALFQVLVRFRPIQLSVTVDERELLFEQVWLLAAANLPFYGGGMKICPGADGTDGLLEVCIIQGSNRWKLVAGIFPKIFSGKHVSHPSVTLLRGETVIVKSGTPAVAHADGEDLGNRDLVLRIRPKALRIIC